MILSELFEEIASPLLYHGTSCDQAALILRDNYIEDRTDCSPKLLGIESKDYVKGVSLSRSKASASRFGKVVFAIDRTLLRHRHRIVPINYYGLWGGPTKKSVELEEFVIGPVRRLDALLYQIIVHKADCDRFRDGELAGCDQLFDNPKLVIR